jgi:glycosyltransferase involved in cell wall biosynthesis
MMPSRLNKLLSPALSVLGAEGSLALRDRLLDRLGARRRRRLYRRVPIGSSSAKQHRVPILNVLATPPRPDFGGIQLQLLRRLEEESQRRPVALFYPEHGGYHLEVEAEGERIACQIDAQPLESALRLAAAQIEAEALHVEGVSGLPLDGLVAGNPGRLVLSIHDFGLFCVRPHLLERPSRRFCNYSRDDQRCLTCLQQSGPVSEEALPRHRALARELLTLSAATLFPSDFLRRVHRDLFPGLSQESWHVVAPAIRSDTVFVGPTRTAAANPRVAFVGSVQAHKGAALLPELLRDESLSSVSWFVLGGGDRGLLKTLRGMPKVHVRGYYRAQKLPDLMRGLRIDCALLPSIWPETYNMVLDDCLRARIPVVAFDLGAPADRIREWGGGILVPLREGKAGLARALEAALRGEVEERQQTPFPTPRSAAEKVLTLYRDLGFSLPS